MLSGITCHPKLSLRTPCECFPQTRISPSLRALKMTGSRGIHPRRPQAVIWNAVRMLHQIVVTPAGGCSSGKVGAEATGLKEGGTVVGAKLEGQVLIVDDVISAGTSVRESVELICATGAQPAGVVIALDRMERGTGAQSAVQEVRDQYVIPVVAVVTLDNLLEYLERDANRQAELAAVAAYRARYGV